MHSFCSRQIEDCPTGGTRPIDGRSTSTKAVLWQKDRHCEPEAWHLVLVKPDAFKGKRKIKDRCKEDTWEVEHQIMTDVPSYEVMDQHRRSHILHQNHLLLIVSEVGIPLCIGIHYAWDRCTSPTPCKPTSTEGEIEMMPQVNIGSAVPQCPASKTSLG